MSVKFTKTLPATPGLKWDVPKPAQPKPLYSDGMYLEILNPGSHKTMYAQDFTFFKAGTPYIAKMGTQDGFVTTVYDFLDGKTYAKVDYD